MGTGRGQEEGRESEGLLRDVIVFVFGLLKGYSSPYERALLRATFALAFFGRDMRPGVEDSFLIHEDRCARITSSSMCRSEEGCQQLGMTTKVSFLIPFGWGSNRGVHAGLQSEAVCCIGKWDSDRCKWFIRHS